MKKKGFTLIELLAVIVILAIIALIATPLVLKYIEKSRQESKVDSAYSFVRNLETEIANFSIKHNGKKYNGQPSDKGYYEISNFENPKIDTTVKGDKPDSIKVCLSSLGQVDKAMFEYGKYYVSYDEKKGSISDKDTYDNFSCSDNASKVEVPKNVENAEIVYVYIVHSALSQNNQGIIYLGASEQKKIDELTWKIGGNYRVAAGFYAPTSLLKNSIPSDGNIEAIVTHLDGKIETVTFVNKGSYWEYSGQVPYGYEGAIDDITIKFYPNCYLNDQDSCEYSGSYHYFSIVGRSDNAHLYHSINMLGETIYFNSSVYTAMVAFDAVNGTQEIYSNVEDVTRIIFDYEDGTQDVFNLKLEEDKGLKWGVGEVNNEFVLTAQSMLVKKFLYANDDHSGDIFKKNKNISTITIEEAGKMKKYNVNNNNAIYGCEGD